MEKKVKELLEKRGQDIKEEWEDTIGIEECKSPIEKLFLIELKYQIKNEPYEEYYWIMPQYKINNYRVDFLIYYNYYHIRENKYPEQNKDRCLIVETDGYLWHGINPNQFTKEKERERKLQKEGWHIMRFSGREIYRNVGKCVDEVIEYFEKIQNKMPEKYR